MTAFDIAEADIVDAGEEQADKKPEKKNWQSAQKAKQAAANPPPEAPPPADEVTRLKREAWELIKRLPNEQQADWLNSCKGANEATFREIISDLKKILSVPQPKQNPRSEKLLEEIYALVEQLPKEQQKGWIEVAYAAVDDAALEHLLGQIKAAAQPAVKPQQPADAEMEIY
jgi:hypothetical protein